MSLRHGATVASLALLPLLATGCGGGDSAGERSTGGKRSVMVTIASFKFAPDPVKVRKGGTVTFANEDKAPHTAQTDLNPNAAEFDTKRLELGDENVVTLDKPGRFRYFCAYHRFMEGTVEVVE
ncbi:MAG: plastocyanin/azurin family copper-binding protein [Actinomycetota bacterium]|nr:plastocyanin/azurin family copper-binding protein [Actinomycetota bacterium]